MPLTSSPCPRAFASGKACLEKPDGLRFGGYSTVDIQGLEFRETMVKGLYPKGPKDPIIRYSGLG